MKARFALDLSESRVALLHRSASGWQPVGAVQMDDDDLDMNIAALRAKAEAYSGEAVRADLILPVEMILYMQLPRMPERDAEEQIELALHGRTPYAIHQLAYDYEFEDGMCLVAIVARETLREAAGFAEGHGIEVASFAAPPDSDGNRRYVPTFAIGAMAEAMPASIVAAPVEQAPEVSVEAEEDVVEVYGPIDLRAEAAAEQAVEIETEADDDAIAAAGAAIAAEMGVIEEADDTSEEVEDAVVHATFARSPASAPEGPVISFSPASERAALAGGLGADSDGDNRIVAENRSRISFSPMGGSEAGSGLSGGVRRGSVIDGAPGSFAARRAAIASITGIDADSNPETIYSPMGPRTHTPYASQVELPKPESPRDESEAMTVFGARGMPEPRLVAARAMVAVAAAVVLLIGLGAFTASWLFGPSDPLGIDEPVAAVPAPALSPSQVDPVVAAVEAAEAADERAAARENATPVDPFAFAGGTEEAPVDPVQAEIAAMDALISETDPDTSGEAAFGADVAEAPAPAPAPIDEPAPEVAVAEPAAPAVNAVDAALAEALGIEAPAPQPSMSEQLASAPLPAADLPDDADFLAGLPEADREAMMASYAATGIWPEAPGVPHTPDGSAEALQLPDEGDIVPSRAVGGLVVPPVIDDRPAEQRPPAGPGVTFDLDERGLVAATPEGTLNPDGILIFAGAPVKTPPERTYPGLEPDERVVGRKPRARPEIDPETQASLATRNEAELARFEATQDVGPGGFVMGPEDVSVRLLVEGRSPRARPGGADQASARDLTAEEAREALFRSPDEGPVTAWSDLAVERSGRPSARPADLAVSAAAAAPQAPAATQAAAPQPEPAVVRDTGPQLPTRASVARAATVEDAISLRKVNLIGVYGTKTKRRALVRLGNGRFLKVKVGDRMDGGVVRAISEDALQYQKGNKQIVIALPQ